MRRSRLVTTCHLARRRDDVPVPVATASRSASTARPTGPRASAARPHSHGTALGLGAHGLRGRQRLVERVDPAEEPAKLEAPEDLLELRAIGRAGDEIVRVDVELEVAPHGREELRGSRLLGVLGHGLRARRRELGCVLEHALERAVLRDQLPCGLVADPGDPRDVVAGVALEPDEVGHLVWAYAVAQLDALGRVDVDVRDATRGHHQADVLGDELERIPVGRDDARLDLRLVGARSPASR